MKDFIYKNMFTKVLLKNSNFNNFVDGKITYVEP